MTPRAFLLYRFPLSQGQVYLRAPLILRTSVIRFTALLQESYGTTSEFVIVTLENREVEGMNDVYLESVTLLSLPLLAGVSTPRRGMTSTRLTIFSK